MAITSTVCLIVAIVCFLLAALCVPSPRLNLTALGLFFWAISQASPALFH